eukprot:TRINITY_DN2648_c0_g1_i1.p2 TRINITY_DN2648_c0_g1~~TRINITY_DN2648_c0_g1_i1.p2  ORF type:complete len:419 (-),score=60.06 TRINITY_DN2648_c0_g1_i1:295-1551(-)
MGIFNWFNRVESKPPQCDEQFKQVWQEFVDTFIDSMQAQGPTVPCPKQEPGERILKLDGAERVVSIGDIHGDLAKAKRAFRAARLIDDQDNWSGGSTVCVQIGDLLDRGDDEVQLLYFMEKLSRQAQLAGGALHVITGNHESMNIAGNYRYATQGGKQGFQRWRVLQRVGQQLKERCDCEVGARDPGKDVDRQDLDPGSIARHAALDPGGPVVRRFLCRYPLVLQVGSSVFVHAGILPKHLEIGLENMDRQYLDWMLQQSKEKSNTDGKIQPVKIPAFMRSRESIVWTRLYSNGDETKCDCNTLKEVLDKIPGAKRMVVGHTIQEEGINTICNNQVYRVDVGLSKGCGNGHPEAVEILGDNEVRYLREEAVQPQIQSKDQSLFLRQYFEYFEELQAMMYGMFLGMGNVVEAQKEGSKG